VNILKALNISLMSLDEKIQKAINSFNDVQDNLFDGVPGVSRSTLEYSLDQTKKEAADLISGKKSYTKTNNMYDDMPTSAIEFMLEKINMSLFNQLYPHLKHNSAEYSKFQVAMKLFRASTDMSKLMTNPKSNSEMRTMIGQFYKPS
jgi:hypothetical protein